MAKQTTTNMTLLDPIFAVPAGAEEEYVHTEPNTLTGASSEILLDADGQELDAQEVETQDYNDVIVGSDPTNVNEDELEVPTDFVVFSQVLRRAPGGQQVIDVVVDVEDIGGAINYEFAVTKV